jgi:hypothetical protein
MRLVLGAGLLCAAWLLLGAGEARADDAPRGASTPSVSAVVGVAHVDAARSKSAPATGRAHAGVRAVIARPVGYAARPVLRTGLATVARVVRPAVHVGEATVGALVPVVDPLSHLPVVRRLPIAAAAETLAGQGLRERPMVAAPTSLATQRGVTTQSPPAAHRSAAATMPTALGVVQRAPTSVLALTGSVPATRAASTSSGGDVPAHPDGQGGMPLPVPTSAGNCSATTDMALPASTPVLPEPAYGLGRGQTSSSTGAPAMGPDNRPD